MHGKIWKCRPFQLCIAKRHSSENGVTCIQEDDHKSRLTCVLEADATKRLRLEGTEPGIHEDPMKGKGYNSLHHYNLLHKSIPMPQTIKMPVPKEAVECGESQKQVCSDKAPRCKSTFRIVVGLLSSEGFWTTRNTRSAKVELCFEVTPWKMIDQSSKTSERCEVMFFIDPEDKEFAEIIKNAWE